jgi:LacI family transcriptional regulator
MAAPKLSDIAKRAGVSPASVSIVLNDRETKRVGPVKQQLILKIAKELGYTQNALAKALVERRTRLLGLMVPLRDPIFFNQFIAQALSGIQSTLCSRGYNLLVYSPSGRPGRATRDQILESKFTDGLIFINTRLCSPRDISDTIRELDDAKIKFTMINSYYGRASIDYVGVDDFAIGEAAVFHLLARGHKSIAFLSGSEHLPTNQQLVLGMRSALSESGMELPDERIGYTEYEQPVAFMVLDRWFANKRNRPTAIFAGDDQLLTHLYDYVEAHGLKVPGDIAILARGNADFMALLRPRPTAFALPTFQMGEIAAERLIDSIEKPDHKRERVLLPFQFLAGQTT